MATPEPPATGILLVSCPDRRGIVAALAQLLYGHGANILDADQHTDAIAGQFFQRIRFDLSEMHVDRAGLDPLKSYRGNPLDHAAPCRNSR